jgi:acetolactate synthase-1/2/3 large subunit
VKKNDEQRTAVDWLVDALKSRGVEWVATLCGHGLDPFFAAAHTGGLRLIDVRNEQTAAYIAEAYGRLTGRPGVCAVSSGVAVANALTGVVNAHFDGAPMLLISGAADSSRLGMGAFQDLDQAALAEPVSRYSKRVESPARILQMLDESWCAATGQKGRSGPAHLMIPMNVQRAPVARAELVRTAGCPGNQAAAGDPARIAKALGEARRPLIVAGSGVFYRGEAAALREFTEAHSIPVVTPIWDRGAFDRPSRSFMGVIGAATGGANLLAEADCIVMTGAAADYRCGYLQPPAIDTRVAVHHLNGGWNLVRKLYTGAGAAEWLGKARHKADSYRRQILEEGRRQAKKRNGLHAVDIVDAIETALPDDGVLLIDGGSIGQWAHQLLCHNRYPSHWLTCGPSGVVGWGLGGAMAARVAHPERPVLLLSGDGAFTFTVAEIECAVRQRIPFVAVVADDQSWGITETGHKKQFGKAISSHLGPIDFAALARSLGAAGVRVTKPDGIAREIRKALRRDTVTVVHVPIVGGNPK